MGRKREKAEEIMKKMVEREKRRDERKGKCRGGKKKVESLAKENRRREGKEKRRGKGNVKEGKKR